MPQKKHAGGPAPGEGDVSKLLSSQKGRREATRRDVLGENKGASPGVIGCPEVPGWSSQPCYGDLKTAAHFSDGRARYSFKGQKQGCTYFTLSFFEKI